MAAAHQRWWLLACLATVSRGQVILDDSTRCHLTDFENRLERMNTICCAIPEGCEDQGLCSSIPSALESQWTDAARTCEQNPCSLSGVDTSQFQPGAGPFEMGMAVCLDAAGMHVLDSATGVDSLLQWPFEQPPLGYPEFSTQAGEFSNNNHFLCICPSSDPTHPFKSRTMFGDNCQSSTDPCGGDPCPVSQNLVGLTPADVQELPCDSWGEGMAAKIASRIGAECPLGPNGEPGDCTTSITNVCPVTCQKVGCTSPCTVEGSLPDSCSLNCAIEFIPFAEGCGSVIDRNFDVMDGVYDGRAANFLEFKEMCLSLPQGLLTGAVKEIQDDGCTANTDGVRSLNPMEEDQGTVLQSGEHIWGTRVSIDSAQNSGTDTASANGRDLTIGPSTLHFSSQQPCEGAEACLDPTLHMVQFSGVELNAVGGDPRMTVVDAKIVFTIDEAHQGDATSTQPMALMINAEAQGKSRYLSDSPSISERTRTSQGVTWSPAAIDGTVATLETPDLSDIVKEVLAVDGWHAGNSMSFIFEETADGTGERWVKTDANSNGIRTPVLLLTIQSRLYGSRGGGGGGGGHRRAESALGTDDGDTNTTAVETTVLRIPAASIAAASADEGPATLDTDTDDAAASRRQMQISYAGGDVCSFSDFDGRVGAVNDACCDDMDSDDDCVSGMPESCDIECAIVYGPFYTECQHMLRIAFNDPAQMTGFGLLNTTCGQLPPAPMIRVVAEGRCSCGSFPQQRGGGGSWSDGWCHH